MKIFGINFNYSPSQKKPITIAVCDFKKSQGLSVLKVEPIYGLKEFDAFLKQKGPWFAGVNFPLGQPNIFVKNESAREVEQLYKRYKPLEARWV